MVKWGMTVPASKPAQAGAEPAPRPGSLPGSLPTTRPLRRWQIFTHWPSLREAIVIWLPTLALVVGAFWLTYHFVQPAPPDHITMTTGAADGAYHQFALKYQRILAREGIRLDLKPSSGSVENLALLKSASADADIQARALRMPLDFSEKVYTLRQHIDFVRGRLNAPASTDGTA